MKEERKINNCPFSGEKCHYCNKYNYDGHDYFWCCSECDSQSKSINKEDIFKEAKKDLSEEEILEILYGSKPDCTAALLKKENTNE